MPARPDKHTQTVHPSQFDDPIETSPPAGKDYPADITKPRREKKSTPSTNAPPPNEIINTILSKTFGLLKDLGIPLIVLLIEYYVFIPRAGTLNLAWVGILVVVMIALVPALYVLNFLSRQKWSILFALIVITLIVVPIGFMATYHPGMVAGTVRDASGNPLANVVVILIDSQGGKHEVTTDADGQYSGIALPPGLVTVYHQGQEKVRGLVFNDVGGYLDKIFRMPGAVDVEIPEVVVTEEPPVPPPTADPTPTQALITTPPTPTATDLPMDVWVVKSQSGVNCRTCAYSSDCPVSQTLYSGAEFKVIGFVEGWTPPGYESNIWLKAKGGTLSVTDADGCYVYSELAEPKQ